MDLNELVKLLAGPVVAFILGRASKQTDATGDHAVQIATLRGELKATDKSIGVIERDQRSQWKAIDEVRVLALGNKKAE